MLKINFIIFFVIFFLSAFNSQFSNDLYAQETFFYNDNNRRDPFIALVTSDGRLINLEPSDSDQQVHLEGISYEGEGNSYAVINGEIVGIGDFVFGYTVFKIQRNRVILLKDKELVEYLLDKEGTNKNNPVDD